jgi:hypothetical protein
MSDQASPGRQDPGRLEQMRELQTQLATVRGQVRKDRRATSVPLLVLGSATALAFIPQVTWQQGFWSGIIGNAFQSLIITAAFAGIWLTLRRRAATAGVGSGRGYGRAALIGLALLLLPAGVVVGGLFGPFLLFAIGLLVAGSMQRNPFLCWFGAIMGVVGVINSLHWITNRLPASVHAPWATPAIGLVLALLTVVMGVVFWRRESRSS